MTGPIPGRVPGDEHARRAAATYGAAVDHYDRPALSFWDRFGAATVSRLRLAPGDRVLDLCCGAGASALPAARAVGAAGHVLGAGLLRLAGVAGPAATAVPGQQSLAGPGQFWDIVLGSGYRATVDALSQEQRDQVRERVRRELNSAAVTTLRTDVVFGTARRPR